MKTLRLQRTSRGAWGVSIAMGAMVWAVGWAAAPAAAEVVYLGETFEVFGPNDANLDLLGVEGGGTDPAQGIVVTHTFLALDTVFSIVLDGAGTPFGDDNPILNALTLEKVPEPSAIALLALGGLGLIGYAGVRRRRGARR